VTSGAKILCKKCNIIVSNLRRHLARERCLVVQSRRDKRG